MLSKLCIQAAKFEVNPSFVNLIIRFKASLGGLNGTLNSGLNDHKDDNGTINGTIPVLKVSGH